jgi:hypothetical protein
VKPPTLSLSTRNAIAAHLGDTASREIADMVDFLVQRIEQLERSKVDITPVVKVARAGCDASQRRRAA